MRVGLPEQRNVLPELLVSLDQLVLLPLQPLLVHLYFLLAFLQLQVLLLVHDFPVLDGLLAAFDFYPECLQFAAGVLELGFVAALFPAGLS